MLLSRLLTKGFTFWAQRCCYSCSLRGRLTQLVRAGPGCSRIVGAEHGVVLLHKRWREDSGAVSHLTYCWLFWFRFVWVFVLFACSIVLRAFKIAFSGVLNLKRRLDKHSCLLLFLCFQNGTGCSCFQ